MQKPTSPRGCRTVFCALTSCNPKLTAVTDTHDQEGFPGLRRYGRAGNEHQLTDNASMSYGHKSAPHAHVSIKGPLPRPLDSYSQNQEGLLNAQNPKLLRLRPLSLPLTTLSHFSLKSQMSCAASLLYPPLNAPPSSYCCKVRSEEKWGAEPSQAFTHVAVTNILRGSSSTYLARDSSHLHLNQPPSAFMQAVVLLSPLTHPKDQTNRSRRTKRMHQRPK
jgi:hypothetical protein